jgi:hypothetical protein
MQRDASPLSEALDTSESCAPYITKAVLISEHR